MKTAAEREAEFRADLDALLKRHSAEIDITDDGKPWGMHSGVVRISMGSKYTDDYLTCLAEYAEFQL